MKRKIFNELVGGNVRWNVYITENRNKNILTVHNQSMGKTVYTNEEITDNDVFKLVRLLNDLKYEHSIKVEDVIKKVNKTCRHLDIVYVNSNLYI